jgi:hypothetical protein
MKCLVGCVALLALASRSSSARVAVVFRLASPPIPVEVGQSFSLCAANVGTANADLTLQFINVRTGTIVISREVVLPPPGSAAGTTDPCLHTTADAIGATANSHTNPPLVVGLVVIKKGLFSRAAATTASLQVTVADSGGPRIVASIPLQLATLTNGRNTPIERVR